MTAVSGNTLSYNGDVMALGLGAQLILLPRVQITRYDVKVSFGMANFSGVGITIQGVCFVNSVVGVFLDLSMVASSRCTNVFLMALVIPMASSWMLAKNIPVVNNTIEKSTICAIM